MFFLPVVTHLREKPVRWLPLHFPTNSASANLNCVRLTGLTLLGQRSHPQTILNGKNGLFSHPLPWKATLTADYMCIADLLGPPSCHLDGDDGCRAPTALGSLLQSCPLGTGYSLHRSVTLKHQQVTCCTQPHALQY